MIELAQCTETLLSEIKDTRFKAKLLDSKWFVVRKLIAGDPEDFIDKDLLKGHK